MHQPGGTRLASAPSPELPPGLRYRLAGVSINQDVALRVVTLALHAFTVDLVCRGRHLMDEAALPIRQELFKRDLLHVHHFARLTLQNKFETVPPVTSASTLTVLPSNRKAL